MSNETKVRQEKSRDTWAGPYAAMALTLPPSRGALTVSAGGWS